MEEDQEINNNSSVPDSTNNQENIAKEFNLLNSSICVNNMKVIF
jgi:hypothetical protein